MKGYSNFLKKAARGGFYIVLFLCLSAIGISSYVMHKAKDSAEKVKEQIDVQSALTIPFPKEDEMLYDSGKAVEEKTPAKKNTETKQVQTEKKTEQKTTAKTTKKAVGTPAVSTAGNAKSTYTMAVSGAVMSPFSGDELVKSKTMGDWRVHSGVDIKANVGTDVKCIADGTVISTENDTMMGNTVKIEHSGGIVSIYSNLDEKFAVKKGETVKAGAVIGKVGESALAECMEEKHLHLEVTKNGKCIDPLSLFPEGKE